MEIWTQFKMVTMQIYLTQIIIPKLMKKSPIMFCNRLLARNFLNFPHFFVFLTFLHHSQNQGILSIIKVHYCIYISTFWIFSMFLQWPKNKQSFYGSQDFSWFYIFKIVKIRMNSLFWRVLFIFETQKCFSKSKLVQNHKPKQVSNLTIFKVLNLPKWQFLLIQIG